MDPSLSLSTSCRILTICSSLDRAVSFVQQIRSLSGPSGDIDAGESQLHDSRDITEELNVSGQVGAVAAPSAPTSNEKAIPWMISNKYYSARVHFLARTVKGLAPFHLKDVPAVIFVWRKGSAYKHHIQRICRDRDIDGSEPEVSLAVRIDSNEEDVTEEEESNDEDEEFDDSAEIDEFLSSKGFEFIDIPASSEQEDENEISTDAIPSLPRVLDALSTVMWPSMQASIRKQKRPPRNARTQPSENNGDGLLDWAHNSLDQGDIDVDSSVVMQTPANRMIQEKRMRKEMEELRQWLEDDDHDLHKDDDDAWGPTRSHAGMSLSPTSEEGELSSMQKDGFDDDFTVFISAPPEDTVTFGYPPAIGATLDSSEGEFPTFASFGDDSFAASFADNESADAETSFDSLAPSTRFSSVMYHSLGSASELGDDGYEEEEAPPAPPNHDRDVSEVDSDDDLPTESEIRASAQKIFGPLLPPSSSSSNARIQEEKHNGNVSGRLGDDDMDFDLTHMVSAIQGMKVEISGLENEDERRKAAARVALGLVYGLDKC